jgi:flagellar hook-basal body complex protein FliE
MTAIDVNSVLQQISRLNAATEMPSTRIEFGTPAASSTQGDFGALLKKSIGSVAALQNNAGDLSDAFERGEKNVDLAQVMLAGNKANLAFTTVNEVRNKLVDAYKDVMNMSF